MFFFFWINSRVVDEIQSQRVLLGKRFTLISCCCCSQRLIPSHGERKLISKPTLFGDGARSFADMSSSRISISTLSSKHRSLLMKNWNEGSERRAREEKIAQQKHEKIMDARLKFMYIVIIDLSGAWTECESIESKRIYDILPIAEHIEVRWWWCDALSSLMTGRPYWWILMNREESKSRVGLR